MAAAAILSVLIPAVDAGVLYSETFSDRRVRNWRVIDEGDVNRPSAWSITRDGVLSQARAVSSSNLSDLRLPGTYVVNNGANWTDYEVRVRLMSMTDDGIGVMFGYKGAKDYYRFSMDSERGYRRLITVRNGVAQLLAEDQVRYEPKRWYEVRASLAGGIVKVSLDGQPVFEVLDSSHPAGGIGLYSWGNTGAYFDDVVVEQVAPIDAEPPAVVPVSVAVSPTSATLISAQTLQFAAIVTGALDTSVRWTLSPAVGSISATGLYAAPVMVTSLQTVTVTATSVADTSKSASAMVTLKPVVSVALTPLNAALLAGGTQQFTATVSGSTNTGVSWTLSPNVGTISPTGLYAAPASVTSLQTVTVKATSLADTTKSASAVVTVEPEPVTVAVSPKSVTLWEGQTQQFTATVTGNGCTSVSWTLDPPVGAISSSGLYTAPPVLQSSIQVLVTGSCGTITDSAMVLLDPTFILSLALSPVTVSLGASEIQQIDAQVVGSPRTPLVWTLTPEMGSLSVNGHSAVYVAPSTVSQPQAVVVEAKSVVNPTILAHSTITLEPSHGGEVLLIPSAVTLKPSQTQSFSATVSGMPNTDVSWSLEPAVGTLSTNGTTAVYTAPSVIAADQTVQVIAASVANAAVKATALVMLTGSVGGAETLIQTFTLKEEFGVNHPRQVVELQFGGSIDPSRSFMIGPDGEEVPYQLLSNGKIAVETSLLAGQELAWRLYSGRAPAAFPGAVEISATPDSYELTNGLTGVRVFRANGQTRSVPISTVSVSGGVATITTAVDHHLETVVIDAEMPAAKLPVTISGVAGGCSYLNGSTRQVKEGYNVWDPSRTVVKIANVTGANCTGTGGILTLAETRRAPIQGIRLRDGGWTAAAGENLTWRNGYGRFDGRVLNGKAVQTQVVDAGPLRATIEVSYTYNRPAKTFNEERSCTMLGFPSTPCTIEAGEGYYRSTIVLERGQPSILIEDDTDMDFAYHVNVYDAVRPDQGRYRGQASDRTEWGHDQSGGPWPGGLNANPSDGFRDFSYSQPLYAGYTTNDSMLQRMAAWNPWAHNTGWYWMLYNKAAGTASPVVGVFAGRASRAVGSGDTGPGIYIYPATAEAANRAGFTFHTGRRGADASAYRTSRMHWGIFVGTKGEDLGDPYQVQNINRQMNLYGGINLSKIAALDTAYRQPAGGSKPLYMAKEAMQRIIDRVRYDSSYYQYLYGAEPTARTLLDSWRDTSGGKSYEVAAEIRECARKMLDAWVNQGGIYHFEYQYWHGGLEMSRRAIMLNDLLFGDAISDAEKRRLYAVMVLFAGVLWDDDFVPLFDGHGLNLGTANMPVQQVQYRQLYALMLADHPMMAGRADLVDEVAAGNLRAEINEFGAQRGSPHYAGASMGPLLSTLQELQVNTGADLFQTESRVRNFAEFFMNFLTPPEVRFGGVRKLVSLGDGSTESSEMFGQMATAFAHIDPTLSARLIGAWTESGKRHSGFHGTTIVKIDDALPSAPLNLKSATFPGWHSVLRSGFGTANESAAWFVNGDHYSDHRHADHGSVALYTLKSPLAVDWGSMYYPQAAGAYMHSMVVPETSIGASWNADSLSTNTGSSPWKSLGVEVFGAFENSSVSTASFQTTNGTRWIRTVQLIHPNAAYPVIGISDRFEGPDAGAGKVFSLNLMAQGTVETPAGPVTPVERLYDWYGTRKELPSASSPFALGAGLNRFRFTGQWNIDWDLYNISSGSQQALLGNWGHAWHPTPEQDEFRQANGRSFSETQHILRVKGTGPFRVLLLPYPKTAPRPDLSVSQNGSDVIVRAGGEETILGEHYYAFRSASRTILTTSAATVALAYGLEISGGPTEVVIQNGQATVTAHGPAGDRRLILPGFTQPTAPIVYQNGAFWLPYAGGDPVTAVVR